MLWGQQNGDSTGSGDLVPIDLALLQAWLVISYFLHQLLTAAYLLSELRLSFSTAVFQVSEAPKYICKYTVKNVVHLYSKNAVDLKGEKAFIFLETKYINKFWKDKGKLHYSHEGKVLCRQNKSQLL